MADLDTHADLETTVGTINRWTATGVPIALATVIDTHRSAPEPSGAKLALSATGDLVGAVSGGCVEGAVVTVLEDILAGGAPRLLRFGAADEDSCDVGLPCGGEIEIWTEALDPIGPHTRFHQLAAAGAAAALVTALDDAPQPAAKLLVTPGAPAQGTLGDAALDARTVPIADAALRSQAGGVYIIDAVRVFIDVIAAAPRLVIVGAIDVAIRLTGIAHIAGWRTSVIDPRARFATADRFPLAERVIAAWPQEAYPMLSPIDQATAIVVLTHDPKLDDAALIGALGTGAGFIGAMGSRGSQERRRKRLLDAGVGPGELERISGPVGLDLGASSAGETAISIMSEIVAVRQQRAGGRLRDGRGSIHDERLPGVAPPSEAKPLLASAGLAG